MTTKFRGYMDAQRGAIEAEVREQLVAVSEYYRQVPPEALLESAKRIVGLLFMAYDQSNSEVVERLVLALVEQRYAQGVSLKEALGVVALPRRVMCNTLRRAYPGEDLHDGIEKLMASVENLSATIIDAYGKMITRTIDERVAAEERFRMLYDRSPVMMQSIDTQDSLIEVNDEWLWVLGYEFREVIGRKSTEFMTPESRQLMNDVVRTRIFDDGTVRDFALQFVKKNGDIVDVLMSAVVVKRASGEIDRALGVLVDVTERLRTERALQISEQYRAIVEKSPLGICIHRGGTIAYANAAMHLLVGLLDGEGLEGKELLAFSPVECHDALLSSMQDALTEDVIPMQETKLLRIDGSFVDVEIVPQRIIYEGAPAMQFVYLDISARKRAEQALHRATISESTLAAQEELIRALSSPLIPFGNGALLMPLIGSINAGRAARIVEELASGVVAHQASVAILDVTGVPHVDAEVADALLRAASVARLLGANVMLTGIQPAMAKVIIELGIDMSGFTVKSSLRDGVAAVMRDREWRAGNRKSL